MWEEVSMSIDRVIELMKSMSEPDQKELKNKLSRHNVSISFEENSFNVVVPQKLGVEVKVKTGPSSLLRCGHSSYLAEAIPNRKPGKVGVIAQIGTGHGICYEVKFEDRSGAGWFEPEELTILPVPRVETR
jgi:hypothetical protein